MYARVAKIRTPSISSCRVICCAQERWTPNPGATAVCLTKGVFVVVFLLWLFSVCFFRFSALSQAKCSAFLLLFGDGPLYKTCLYFSSFVVSVYQRSSCEV